MSSTKRQGAFGSRNTPEKVPRHKKVQEVETADEHIVLVLTNLHNSLKWVFTVLMGGSVYFAASTLFSIQANMDFPPAEPTLLFVLFSLTFFRFYWGWSRYSDLRNVEVPRTHHIVPRSHYRSQGTKDLRAGNQNRAWKRNGFQHVPRCNTPLLSNDDVIYVGWIDRRRGQICKLVHSAIVLQCPVLAVPYHFQALPNRCIGCRVHSVILS